MSRLFGRTFTLAVLLAMVAIVLACARPTAADIPVGYYTDVDTSSAANLRDSVHEAIDDHTRFPYTSASTDVWDIVSAADEDPNNSSNVLDVYKNASYPKSSTDNEYF